jgi:sodium-dependent dicarboxylate transporter 2/3/5
VALVGQPKQAQREGDPLAGYADYRELDPGESIADHYVARYRPPGIAAGAADTARRVAGRTQLTMALIAVAALLWATGAMPIGTTAWLVAVVMTFGGVMRADAVAQAFAKDAVVFIYGVLALSRVLTRTGLDRRLATLLLTPVRGPRTLLFVFMPLFAMACSFVSETILVTLVMPLFLMVWRRLPRDRDEDLGPVLVLFALVVVFGANLGGPGSPAAGGRNAIMVGILADYGSPPGFVDWLRYGLPFVPVAALAAGLWFYAVFHRRLPAGALDVAAVAKDASARLGPLTRDEKITAAVALGVVALWLVGGTRLGLGAPVLAGLIVLHVLGVTDWRNLVKVPWDVVFLYGGASALGKALAVGGAALFLADGFVAALPARLLEGVALPMVVSLVTGTVTNFMSDGATVAALGPIMVPMAGAAGVHPWAVGFATAFASSFAHMLIIGTPASALVYILCRDPRTGRQLVTRRDFLKHGAAVWVLSFAVLWGWAFLGYWRWFGLVP